MNRLRLCCNTVLLIGLTPFWLSAQISVEISGETTVSATQADIAVSGDWNNRGTLDLTGSRLIMNGSEDQVLSDSAGNILSQLVLQKSGGLLYLADTVRIADSLQLLGGRMVTADTSLLILFSEAAAGKGDAAGFVDGPVIKVFPVSAVEDTFWFPTGDGNDFRPVTVSLSEVALDTILVRVEQINRKAVSISDLYDDLDRVSTVRYWQITGEGPGTFTGARITLSYDTVATGDGVEHADELRVACLNTTDEWIWQNLGGSGSKDHTGRIRSDAFSSFGSGYFTFGDASGGGDISLPVVLSRFDISQQRGEVILDWRSESEINNRYWQVQRQSGPDSNAVFETIARIDGQGSKPSATDYTFLDHDVNAGKEYAYRLVDVSFRGAKHVHPEQRIRVGLPPAYQLHQNYPNPFNPMTHIMYDLPVYSEVNLAVYDILGRKVATLVSEKQTAGYYELTWEGNNRHESHLASGMYILAIRARGLENGREKTFAQVRKIMLIR